MNRSFTSLPKATSDIIIHPDVDAQDSFFKFDQEIVLTKDQFELEHYF